MNLETTQAERSQCLADMADAEYGTLVGYDIEFGFARSLITDIDILQSRLDIICGVVQQVLNDSESQEGGWGPDVTTVEKLRHALEHNA